MDVRRYIVSPGSPVDISSEKDLDSNKDCGNDSGYAPEGALRIVADGPVSAFTGADGTGYEATCYFPISVLSQRVPIPTSHVLKQQNSQASIAICSPYKGTARVFNSDGSLFKEVLLERDKDNAESEEEQLSPASAIIDGKEGTFSGGWVDSDVPIYVVHNSYKNESIITNGVPTNGDEIALVGITPEEFRANITKDFTSGLLYKQVVVDGKVS